MSIGVPIKLLHEAQGHVVTLELNNGTVYRGKLSEGNFTWFILVFMDRSNSIVI
jgi:hypothetical protein